MKIQWRVGSMICVLGALLLWTYAPVTAQGEPAAEFYQLLNQVRLDNGLAPLGASTLLQQAAQHHAEDIATRGTASHEGSDGSDYRQRIRTAGYRAWNDGLLVNEAAWIGLGSASDALNWFRNDPASWELFVDARYREIGVGYAADNQGAHYFVVTFGSRPGVLPVFINDGMGVTESPQVAVRLTNEEAEPLGEGLWMGKAIEVRLSDSPDFDDVPWQPWEPLLPWLLANTEPGDYAVYVEFRDGASRTTISEATVRLVEPGEAPLTPTPRPDSPPVSTLSPTASPTGETPAVSPTQDPGTLVSPTSTSPTSASPTSAPQMTGAPAASTPVVLGTPLPTWTPLPIEDTFSEEPSKTDWPVLTALALQGMALILGLAAFLRRRWP